MKSDASRDSFVLHEYSGTFQLDILFHPDVHSSPVAFAHLVVTFFPRNIPRNRPNFDALIRRSMRVLRMLKVVGSLSKSFVRVGVLTSKFVALVITIKISMTIPY